MSAEERKKILQMVEEGKISAEQAASLMKALETEPTESEIEVVEAEPTPGFDRTGKSAPEFESVKARARQFAMIPLWIGVTRMTGPKILRLVFHCRSELPHGFYAHSAITSRA